MDRYPSTYTEAEIAEVAAVRRAHPLMVWPTGAGGYAILAECSGAWVAGPFSAVHEAYEEVDRMNEPYQRGTRIRWGSQCGTWQGQSRAG